MSSPYVHTPSCIKYCDFHFTEEDAASGGKALTPSGPLTFAGFHYAHTDTLPVVPRTSTSSFLPPPRAISSAVTPTAVTELPLQRPALRDPSLEPVPFPWPSVLCRTHQFSWILLSSLHEADISLLTLHSS